MSEAGLEEVKTYILRHQITIAQYIATCPILELCMEAERRPEARGGNIWLDKGWLELEGEQAEDRSVEAKYRTEGVEDGDKTR